MSLSLTINGVDFTSKWRVFDSHWTQRAYMGESVQSQLIIDDDLSDIDHLNLASRKVVEIWEDASGSPVCMYRGRVANKVLGRGPSPRVGDALRWTVDVEDYNIDLRGIRIDESTRPSESDYTRVQAYRSNYLSGASSPNANARASTDLGGTYVLNSDTVTLPAETYTDTFPADVFNRITEFSGKTFFVFVDDAGAGQLYYADQLDDSLLSDIEITDDELQADGVDVYNPFLEPTGAHDGQRVITGGSIRYGTDQFYEESDIAGGETFHDKWEEHFTDQYVTDAATAEALLEKIVHSRSNEDFTFTVKIAMDNEHAHRIRAGMMVNLRLASANKPTMDLQRAVSVDHQPIVSHLDYRYLVTIELSKPRVKPLRRNIITKPVFPPTPTEPGTPGTPDADAYAWNFVTGNATSKQKDDTGTWEVTGRWSSGGWAYSTTTVTAIGNATGAGRPPATAGTTYGLRARFRNNSLSRNPNGVYATLCFHSAGGTLLSVHTAGATGANQDVWTAVDSGPIVAPPTTATIGWGIHGGTGVTPSDGAAGSAASCDYAIIYLSGTGTPATSGTGGINPAIIGDTPNQYAQSTHSHLNVTADEPPTITDDEDEGFRTGTFWYVEDTGSLYVSVDHTAGEASWVQVLTENSTHTHDELATAPVFDHEEMGTDEEFDVEDGENHQGVLDDDVEITLAGAVDGEAAWMTLKLEDDGSGPYTITWPAEVVWPGGVAPTPPAAGEVLVVALFSYDGGTTWYGSYPGAGGATSEEDIRDAGRWEVVMEGSAPPEPVTNEAEDDWLYDWVSG